jgi:glutamyl-tRNA reductase
MIGVSLENRVGPGRGPRLCYSEPGALSSVRRPHDDVLTLLRTVRDEGSALEGLIWNTCHRFEFYGWLEKPSDCDCVVAQLRSEVFGNEPAGLAVNVLFGQEAWHHLVRTAAGLNSGLPGDADVVEQLQAARRVAEGAGTTGPRLIRLLNEAVATVRAVRRETEWGRHDPGYCLASISRIGEAAGLDLPDCRHVVIGGSTTSCSVLGALRERLEVSPRQMTLIYRSHRGGQIKLLRKAISNGKRVRAQHYTEQAVLEAIAEADVVYFGIDSDAPVLRAHDLREVRDFVERPLTVIDFNTFGSTEGLVAIDGVTVWHAARLEQEVAAYAETMSAEAGFAAAVDEAEAWIAEHLPPPVATKLDMPCIQGQEVAHPWCTGCRVKTSQAMVGSAGQ